jgi:hypothetical protein
MPRPQDYNMQSRWTHPGTFISQFNDVPNDQSILTDVLSGLILHQGVLASRGIPVPVGSQKDPALRTVEALLQTLLDRDDRAFDSA